MIGVEKGMRRVDKGMRRVDKGGEGMRRDEIASSGLNETTPSSQ
jgi:hypothetical protein